jgi:serine/threonine protein kinase
MSSGGAVHQQVPSPGQLVAGKYRIDRLLGEGGMAFVFQATRMSSADTVALKVMAPDFAKDAELVARFDREAHAVARLDSPHVVRLVDVDRTESGLPFLVMEFLKGRDLEAELAERKRIPVPEAVDYVLQACAAMMTAHAAGIVHRDLKPANLYVTGGGGAPRIVKVLDFGISKMAGASKLTAAGAIMGTVLYMSPEQIRASKDVDERTDIWSLGVILFELLAGRAPFEGSSQEIAGAILKDVPPDVRTFVAVPDGVANAINAMLRRDLTSRTPSVRDVVRSLGPFAAPGSAGARVAEALARPGAGPQQYTVPLGKSTVPLMQAPPAQPSSAEALPPPRPSVREVRPAPGEDRDRERSPVVLGAVLGFTGAMGVALIAAWWWLSHHPAPARPLPPPVVSSTPSLVPTTRAPTTASPSSGAATTPSASAASSTSSASPATTSALATPSAGPAAPAGRPRPHTPSAPASSPSASNPPLL